MLDGVHLVPSPNGIRASCEAMAAELRGAIPCPTMLPLQVADKYCSPISICTDGEGAFVAVIALATPPDFPGASVTQEGFANGPHVQLVL